MLPFLEHVESCKQCRDHPRFPCERGYELFHRGAETLAKRLDPQRAKA